ncbi:MAG: CNNM domain-containing protein [Sulfurovum sp.]|nr:CNNM domain-containing protein [Sulfurovum sp.]
MDLLLLYFFGAVIISFVCSVLESVLLSVNMPYISVLEKERPKVGALLKSHKTNLNKSIASILILNTIANTLGAAAVGAQAESLYGAGAVFYVSIILTFAILFLSEIIPKTMGAVYWKSLAPSAAYVIQFFIWMTYPIILLTLFVTNRIKKSDEGISLTKAELIESTLMSEDEGVLDEQESDIIENILLLDKIKIEAILTPRTVVFGLDGKRSIKDIVDHEPAIFKFSRVPVYDGDLENITGMVMTKKSLNKH